MTTAYEIPLQPQAQSFRIQIAGVTYGMTVTWNNFNASWILDIVDVNNDPLVSGIPLITGTDLLAQYAYMGFGGSLYAQTDHDTYAVPTYANLGQQGHLYFVTNP
jgi:hypothetical protein